MQNIKPLGLAVAMGLILDVAGSQHVYGLEDAKGANREVITAAMLLAVALLWLFARPADADGDDSVPFWIAALPAAAAMLSITDIMTFVDTGWTTGRALLFGGGCAALLALALRRAPGIMIAGGALVFGVVLRAINMQYIPIEPSRGDMLPLVQQALTNFVAGQSPYAWYTMPWILPLTYFPLTWLAYLPAHLLGFDFRWINVCAEVAVLGAAMFVARNGRAKGAATGDGAIIIWAWLFLSPTVVHWDLTTTAPIGWAAIAWALALVVTHQRQAPIALGIAAATTPFIAVFMPFIALNWWRSEGLSVALRRLARAALVAGVLLLPFFVWAPQAFVDGTVRWFNDVERFPRLKWLTERTWGDITGFSGLFWQWRLEQWLKPIQLATTMLIATIYAVRGARRSDLLSHATAAFLIFMLFNPVLWPYLYNPALVAALLAAGGALPEPARAVAPTLVQRERRARRQDKRYPSSTT